MKIYIKALKNVENVNAWEYTSQFDAYSNQTNDMYFQVVNKNRGDSFRYMPADGATASVYFSNLDNAKKITIQAYQPFPKDPSIWKLTIASNVTVSTGNVVFNLTEGGVTKSYVIDSFINTISTQVGSC